MIEKIISGGQTGADQGGLDAAIAKNIPHGGWCPFGRKSESGIIPLIYNLQETHSINYTIRTKRNVQDSDGTIIFTRSQMGKGSRFTFDYCRRVLKKPCLIISPFKDSREDE